MKDMQKTNDPVKRQMEVSAKDRGSELSPMSPPEAYDPPSNVKVEYSDLHSCLKLLVDDHVELVEKMNNFEIILKKLQKNSALATELNKEINNFFTFFNQEFIAHNKKEEKYLFPILNTKFLEHGEHSKSKNPITPIDVLEDEHIEATRIATEANYIWNLALKINDTKIQLQLFKEFLIKSLELIEITKLHIFREDNIVFSLAQKFLSEDELNQIDLNIR